jgi:predicted transcriptional regulator
MDAKREAVDATPNHSRVAKRDNKSASPPTDAILAINDPYMMQIVNGEKNYEFRKYQIAPSVERIWFYRTAPHSCLEYICEIDPGATRGHEDNVPLPENGSGNSEFNEFHKDWEGYDWAYRIRSVFKIKEPVTLEVMRDRFGFKSAPRGLVYVPSNIKANIPWEEQEKLL